MTAKRGKGKLKKGTPQKDNRRSKSVSSDEERTAPVKLSVFRYDFERILNDKAFAFDDVVKNIPSEDLNMQYYSRTGFVDPLHFQCDPAEIGMRMPKDFTVNDVVSYLGEKRLIEVVEVSTQDAKKMSLKEFVDYYNTPKEKRGTLYNVLSLEFSLSEMTDIICGPALVNEIDWITNHFPDWRRQRYLKFDDKSGLFTSHTIYPKVQKYCLMSVSGCYTDFHIDFGGSSVWYHVLKGQKVFWVIEPSDTNIRIYEEFNKNQDQTGFFGDVVEKCARVTLNAGDTLMIPPGWIHAVYTPVDSLVFGGNFVHSMGASMQINVMQSENRIQISKKHRLPFFEELMLYVIADHVKDITGRVYLRPFQKDAYTYYDYVGKHWLADKRHHKKIVREDYPNLVHHDLIMQDDSSDDDSILRIVSDPEDRNRYAQYLMKDEENKRACISGLEAEDDETIFYDGGDPNILSPATSHRLHVFEEYEPALNFNDDAMEFISPKMQKELEYMLFYLKGRRSLNIPEGLNRCASLLSAYERCLQRRRSILEDREEELPASPWTRQGRLTFRRPPQPREKSLPKKSSHSHRRSRPVQTDIQENTESAPESSIDSLTRGSTDSQDNSQSVYDDEDDQPLAAIAKKVAGPVVNYVKQSESTPEVEPCIDQEEPEPLSTTQEPEQEPVSSEIKEESLDAIEMEEEPERVPSKSPEPVEAKTEPIEDELQSESKLSADYKKEVYKFPKPHFSLCFETTDFELDDAILRSSRPSMPLYFDLEEENPKSSRPSTPIDCKPEEEISYRSTSVDQHEHMDLSESDMNREMESKSSTMDQDFGAIPPDDFLEPDHSTPLEEEQQQQSQELPTVEELRVTESDQPAAQGLDEIVVEPLSPAHGDEVGVMEEPEEEEIDIVGEKNEDDEKPKTRGRARASSNASENAPKKEAQKRGRPRRSSTSKDKKKKEKDLKRKSSKSFEDALNSSAQKKKKHDPKKDKPQFVGGLPVAAFQDDPVVPNPYNYDPKAEIMKLGTGQLQSAYRKSRQNIAPPKDKKMYKLHHEETEHHDDEQNSSVLSPLSVSITSRRSENFESPSPIPERSLSMSSSSRNDQLYSPTMSDVTPSRRFSESTKDWSRPVVPPTPNRRPVSQSSTDASDHPSPSPRTPKTPNSDPRLTKPSPSDASTAAYSRPVNPYRKAYLAPLGSSNGHDQGSIAVRKLSDNDVHVDHVSDSSRLAPRRDRAISSPEPAPVPENEKIPAQTAINLLKGIVAELNELNNA